MNAGRRVRVHALQRADRAQRARIERGALQVRVVPVHGCVTGCRAVHLRDREATETLHVIEHDVDLRLALRGELPLHLLNAVTGFHANLRSVGTRELLALTGRLEHVGDLGVQAGDRRIPVTGRWRVALPRDVRVSDGFHLRDDAFRQVLRRLLEEHVVHGRRRSLVKVFRL